MDEDQTLLVSRHRAKILLKRKLAPEQKVIVPTKRLVHAWWVYLPHRAQGCT